MKKGLIKLINPFFMLNILMDRFKLLHRLQYVGSNYVMERTMPTVASLFL